MTETADPKCWRNAIANPMPEGEPVRAATSSKISSASACRCARRSRPAIEHHKHGRRRLAAELPWVDGGKCQCFTKGKTCAPVGMPFLATRVH